MISLLKLVLVFFKIGMFCFGGGYAMIPLIQDEIVSNNWLSVDEFFDIIAITEITPGPIAVNSATFVGQRVAGILGSLCATIGVVLPSVILILIVCHFFFKFNQSPIKRAAFYCIRPAVSGMILAAAFSVAETSIFKGALTLASLQQLFTNITAVIDFKSLFVFGASLALLLKTKINPMLVLVLSAVAGIVFF